MEVNGINRQIFIRELGKLLTFMTEADRQTALNFYTELFDSARDEDELMHRLSSPTKQAVLLARSYSAPDKRLDGYGHGAVTVSAAKPSYMAKLEEIRADALAAGILGVPDEAALEDDGEELFGKYSEEELAAAVPDEEPPAEPEAEPVTEPEPKPVTEPEPKPATEPEPKPATEPEIEPATETAEPAEASKTEVPSQTAAAETEESTPEQSVEAAPEQTPTVDAAAAPTSDEAVPAAVKKAVPTAAKEAAPTSDSADSPVYPVREAYDSLPEINEDEYIYTEEAEPIYRLKPLALILFLIVAIPVTLLGILLLLVPTMLALTVAGAAMALGALLLTAAFGSFSMLSDFLVVLGGAIILLALSLLFAWLFVWLIGGAVTALVRGIVRLGRKLCCKEVAVQ